MSQPPSVSDALRARAPGGRRTAARGPPPPAVDLQRCPFRARATVRSVRACTQRVPCPYRVRRQPHPGQASRPAPSRRAAFADAIDLVEHLDLRHVVRADRRSTSFDLLDALQRSGSPASMTCSSSVASRASCSVERNAATSSCGRSRTKPTVSASNAICEPGTTRGGAPSGSSVANN